jgi:hypothetical protein
MIYNYRGHFHVKLILYNRILTFLPIKEIIMNARRVVDELKEQGYSSQDISTIVMGDRLDTLSEVISIAADKIGVNSADTKMGALELIAMELSHLADSIAGVYSNSGDGGDALEPVQ